MYKQSCAGTIKSSCSILSVTNPQPRQGTKLKPQRGGAGGTAKVLGKKQCAGAISTTKELKPGRILRLILVGGPFLYKWVGA